MRINQPNKPIGKSTRLWILLLAALAAGFLPSRAAATTVAAKPDYSKEAAVMESYRTVYRFENDGTYTQTLSVRVKVQSPAGVQQYGVLVFSYASDVEHMEFDYVRVRHPDGTVVVTPPSSIEDVTPQVTISAPEYSDLREKHVPVRGLTPGSELEYRVHSTVKPLIPGQFWMSYDFTKSGILLDEELKVDVPKHRAIKLESSFVQPVVSTQGNRRIYLWKHSNPKAQKQTPYPEGQVPPPDVLLSTFQSWARVGAWWRKLEQPQMAPTADIRAKAAELTKGLTTEQQKLRAIYSYVAAQFRYISISFGVGRYRPHSASQVLSNGYGDCKDKATLLASLLQAAGIDAWPALINSGQRLDPGVPTPGQFDHVITVVPEGKNLDWMDTTTELAPLGLLTFDLRGKQALVVPNTQPAYLAMTPAQPSVPSRVTFEADGELTGDGTFTGKIKEVTDGDRALIMRLIYNTIAQSYWQKVTQGISERLGFGGTVSNVQVTSPEDTSHPFALSYDYVRKDYSNWSPQSPHEITPPLPFLGLPALPHSADKTPQPLVLGEPTDVEYRATIKLPKGWTATLPKPLDLSTPFAEYHSAYSFKDGVVTAERRVMTKADEIPVAEFDAYRKLQKAVSSDIQNQITLTGGAGATAAGTRSADELNSAAVDLLNKRENLSLARDLLLKATAKDPKNKWAWNNLGRVYTALGDTDHAIRAFQKQIEVNPQDQYAYNNLGQAYATLGETDDAIRAYKKQIEVHPQDRYAYGNLGFLYMRLGRFDDAAAIYQKQVEAHPADVEAYERLGSIFAILKKWTDAAQAYEHAVSLNPTSRLELALARAYDKAGDREKAVAAYEKAATLNPAPEAWNDAGYYLADAGIDLPEAERFATLAVKAEESAAGKIGLANLTDADLRSMPTLAAYWDTLAWVYFREGKLPEARKYEAASLSLDQAALVADHLGQIDEKLGRRLAAIHDYAMAVALGSTSPYYTIAPGSSGFSPSASGFNVSAPDATERLRRLTGSGSRSITAISKARDETSSLRTYRLSKAGLKPGTAEFFVLLSPGEKAAKVKFISGPDNLRAAASRLAALRYRDTFPDDGPAKILRRGIFSCTQDILTCDFVLLAPDSVHSVE